MQGMVLSWLKLRMQYRIAGNFQGVQFLQIHVHEHTYFAGLTSANGPFTVKDVKFGRLKYTIT